MPSQVFLHEDMLDPLWRGEDFDVPVDGPEKYSQDHVYAVVVLEAGQEVRDLPVQLPPLLWVQLHLLPLEQLSDSRTRPVGIVPGSSL